MRFEKTIILRVPMEMYNNYLIEIDNYSLYIRGLVEKDRLEKGDQKFIDLKINEHKQKIQELQDLKQKKQDDGGKVQECLNVWYSTYKASRVLTEDRFNLTWISDKVLPELKKLGCNRYSANEVLDIFYNHAKEKKLIINV